MFCGIGVPFRRREWDFHFKAADQQHRRIKPKAQMVPMQKRDSLF
jgi:hypothetical protein